ncbi:MAG: NERD domain-containing protein [Candidatus Sumerlaeaceae bacterium]
MAVMIPDALPIKTNAAETDLFNRFRAELPDEDYIVLHSLGLARHERKRWGESDFVVIGPEGIFVLEIKGGSVSCYNGNWTYEDLWNGKRRTSREGPFEQAKSGLFAIEKDLNRFFPELRNYIIGYGVMMKDEEFSATGCELTTEVLWDTREWRRPLPLYVEQLADFWQKKYGRKPRLDAPTRERIRQALRPDIRSAVTFGSRLNGLETRMVELKDQQARIVGGVHRNRRTIVEGPAGTGKTLIATDRALAFAHEGREILFLCFNTLLAEHLKCGFEAADLGGGSIDVAHMHELLGKLIAKSEGSTHQEMHNLDDDFYRHVLPTKAMESLDVLKKSGQSIKQYDVVIVDEAQDLLSWSYVEVLDALLKDGFNAGRCHLFMDPNQNIFEGTENDVMSRLEESGFSIYPLDVNCRNTREVAEAATMLSSVRLATNEAIRGGRHHRLMYGSIEELLAMIEDEIKGLLNDGIGLEQIIFLSPRVLKHSVLANVSNFAGVPLGDVRTANSHGLKRLEFCTMQAFKGLERRIVFATDLDLEDPSCNMLYYCGLSRAVGVLYAAIPKAQETALQARATAYGELLAG